MSNPILLFPFSTAMTLSVEHRKNRWTDSFNEHNGRFNLKLLCASRWTGWEMHCRWRRPISKPCVWERRRGRALGEAGSSVYDSSTPIRQRLQYAWNRPSTQTWERGVTICSTSYFGNWSFYEEVQWAFSSCDLRVNGMVNESHDEKYTFVHS